MQDTGRAFGRWLQGEMDRADLNLSGLSARIGIAHTSVLAWMDGKTRPRPENVRRLARALGVTVTEVHIALGDIPRLNNLTESQRHILELLMELDDPQVCQAVEALLLTLQDAREKQQ